MYIYILIQGLNWLKTMIKPLIIFTLPYGKSATYLVINKIIFLKFKTNSFILETRCSY